MFIDALSNGDAALGATLSKLCGGQVAHVIEVIERGAQPELSCSKRAVGSAEKAWRSSTCFR